IESHTSELEKSAEANGANVASAGASALVIPGVKLAFVANPGGPRTFDYSTTAASFVATYDKNKNGYIDKEEMPGNLAATFAMYDTNDDGKVYAEEIKAVYERQMAPTMSQVRANVTAQGNS